MRDYISNDYLTLLCRVIFGAIFIYASIDKIANPEQFARIMYNYHILPGGLINLSALVLPITELIAGICLITGILYTGSRNYLVILMVIFIVAIGVNVIRGVNLECGCFTVSSKAKSAGIEIIIRDLIMLVPGFILLLSRSRRWVII
jgi:uncharacterized membrane protein YphA (DoxX/SURF4 family)